MTHDGSAAGADADEALMGRYQGGNERAFEQLYARHKGPLYRYLLRQCGNAAHAEELFQDVWLKLIRARHRYRPQAKFTTYLYHMAHNRLIDHYRSQQRGLPPSYGEPLPVNELPAAETAQPEQLEQRRRQIERLLALIGQLPEAQREAFLLQQEAGLSLADIAAVTDSGQETVKSRLRYAVNKLRQGMRDDPPA